jgi:wyosine [tRNA(Phe)-imidazoG37] synthetase (radical SAM superfamily)
MRGKMIDDLPAIVALPIHTFSHLIQAQPAYTNNTTSRQGSIEQDTMLTTKKWNYVFGPVPSRRLGLSLGVDVIPKKVCTLDCVYCEVGMTDKRALRRREYFPAESIIAEVEEALSARTALDYVSFSGSGEPTLNSRLGEIIRAVKQMSSVPVAVITNGTLLSLEDVRFDLMPADVVLPSLDAVSPEVFQKMDRPHAQLKIEEIIEGMKEFRKEYKGKIWLEIMIAKGYNDHDEEVAKLREVVLELRPDKIQLNTVVRPPSEPGVEPVTVSRLTELQAFFGENCEIIGTYTKHRSEIGGKSNATEILALLERRAMTIEGLVQSQTVGRESIVETLRALKEAGLIISFVHQDVEHFRAKEAPESERSGAKSSTHAAR